MSNSEKISQFQTDATFQSGDSVTGLSGGMNVNFSYSALYNALSGFGSFNNVGASLGTPLLDQPAPGINNIRKLESTKGIVASVSASNGVNLGCNFIQSNSGAKIIPDLNASQYRLKTILAGAGVNINELDESIRIDLSPDTAASKTVTVSTIADFPEAVAGVITLDADTDYLLTEDISTSNRLVVARPNTLRAASSQMVSLTYTGTGAMFTGVNPSFKIVNITVSCPNGSLYSTSAPTLPGIVQMVESNVSSCQSLGTIDGNFITRFTNVAFENLIANGLTFTGAHQILVVDTGVAFLNGGSLIDLNSATFQSLSITGGVIAESAPGTFFLSGLPNSGNIVAGGLGTVINNKGFGSGSSLNGISTDDARFNFLANNSIADTRPDTLLSFTTPTTTTLVAATPALINGTWVVERSSQMTGTVAGRATYDGEKGATLPITLTVSMEPVSGTNKAINLYLAKNGSVVANSKVITTISAGSAKNQSVVWQDVFNNGDYYEAWIESVDGTDVQVNTAKLRVN